MSDDLLMSVSEGVVRLTLNRPDRRNALSTRLLESLESALARIAADASARVVVLSANGPAFCAGHDLSEMIGRGESDYRVLFELCARVMLGIRELPQPVIARVHGAAWAAGCQLVAACDMAAASDEATFATPGVKIGLFCTTPMVPLIRAAPAKVVREMLFTGRPISAERAREIGLVNHVTPLDELDDVVDDLTAAILAASPYAARVGKRAMGAIENLDERSAYREAVAIMTSNALASEAQEGMTAFLEKRAPLWPEG